METTGDVDLHLDDNFSSIFSFAAKCAIEYLTALRLDAKLHDVILVKSWLNAIKEFNTPLHNHADAHLSFVYYVHTPEEYTKKIVFQKPEPPNELYHGMMSSGITEWNIMNSQTWWMEAKEGTLYMFPGKLHHMTNGYGNGQPDSRVETVEDLKDRRISIAGDFILTYRNKSARAYGIQPMSNWKIYRGE